MVEAQQVEVAAPALGPQLGPQWALVACPVEDALFGGARGGGKTHGILLDWLSHQDEHGKHARGLLARRSQPELDEVQAQASELFPGFGGVYRVQARTWVFPSGASLKLRHLERDDDAEKYQGHAYTWIGVDEAGNFPSPTPIDKLRACLRSTHGIPCFLRLTGNPGGVGHNWLKRRYIDPAPPMTPHYDDLAKCWRVFIPSKLADNPALALNDPGYVNRIAAATVGNDSLLKAWLDGDWDIVAGGMFDDLWLRSVHVLEPFRIPKNWRVDRAFDWGSTRPYSVGFWAESDGTEAPNGRWYPPGTLFRIAEMYGCVPGQPNVGTKRLASEVGREILQVEQTLNIQGRVEKGPADPSIFSVENGKSIGDDMRRAGVAWTPGDHRPGSRKNGWERMRKYLKAALPGSEGYGEEPALYVFETCVEWIRTVPTLPRDKKKSDDVDTTAEDHAGDETRYRLLAATAPVVGHLTGIESALNKRLN